MISYMRHRFPPEIIAHAVWLYCRFNMSFREVEELLLERGTEVSYETIRRWVAKFGPVIVRPTRVGWFWMKFFKLDATLGRQNACLYG